MKSLNVVTPACDKIYDLQDLPELFNSEVKMHQGRVVVYKNSTKKSLDEFIYGCISKKPKKTLFSQLKEDNAMNSNSFTIEKLSKLVGTKVIHCENRLLTYRIAKVDYLQSVLVRSGSYFHSGERKDVLFERLVKQLNA